MPQLLSQDTSGSVVTVAELVRRCAPEQREQYVADSADDEELGATTAISVDALLKREGRTDLAPDRPLVIAGWTVPGQLVRRGAIAAGALLAAGTVFGLTGFLNAAGHQPVVNGNYSDEGSLATAADSAADPTSDLPTTDPVAVETTTVDPTALPAVVPVALGGAEIARHAIVPAARSAAVAPPATSAAPVTTSSAPTSDPKQDDAQDDDPPTSDKHGNGAHEGTSRTTSPTVTTRPTSTSTTAPPTPTSTTPPTPTTTTPTTTPTAT